VFHCGDIEIKNSHRLEQEGHVIYVQRESSACSTTLDVAQTIPGLLTFAERDAGSQGRHGCPVLFFQDLHSETALAHLLCDMKRI
jgi:hypothetical protein